MRPRVIPVLTVRGGGLVKTVQFGEHTYVGDPLNAVRLFNEMEVDELVLLDIDATREGRGPDTQLVEDVASECFMPLCYGGGISTVEQASAVFDCGVEKVALNCSARTRREAVVAATRRFGGQAIVGCVDAVRGRIRGPRLYDHVSGKATSIRPVDYAVELQDAGIGEILLTSVDRDGTMSGYDLELLRAVASAVSVPLVACGGASAVEDLGKAVQAGADAVAAGSLFLFKDPHRGVLINYPTQEELEDVLGPW